MIREIYILNQENCRVSLFLKIVVKGLLFCTSLSKFQCVDP